MSDKKSSEKNNNSIRARNYTALIYPDSKNTPDNWFEVLGELQLEFLISPLHDKDITDTGENKKPHYHVILLFDTLKTRKQAEDVFSTVGGVIPPKIKGRDMFVVSSIKSAARYLCHIDNPDKAQYNVDDVKVIGSINYLQIINLEIDRYQVIQAMVEFCKQSNIDEYYKLFEYAMEERPDWFRVLCDNGTYVMKEYLRSRHFNKVTKQLIDKDTGEVVVKDINKYEE